MCIPPAASDAVFKFWRRRTTAGSTAADPRSRPIRVPECKRRRQHSCMGHAGRAEQVWLPVVAFRLSPSRFEPRRVGRTGSSGFHILGPDPVGARGSTPEQCSETGLADGAASAARQHLFHGPGRCRISDDGICSSRAVRCPSACRKFGSCTRGCATEPPRSAPRIGAFRALIRGASPRFGARFGALRPDSGHFLRSLRRRAGGGWGRKGGRNGGGGRRSGHRALGRSGQAATRRSAEFASSRSSTARRVAQNVAAISSAPRTGQDRTRADRCPATVPAWGALARTTHNTTYPEELARGADRAARRASPPRRCRDSCRSTPRSADEVRVSFFPACGFLPRLRAPSAAEIRARETRRRYPL